MWDWLQWFTHMGNSKVTALVIFFALFVGILYYVFGQKQRSERLESYKYMPFEDDDTSPTNDSKHKGTQDERD